MANQCTESAVLTDAQRIAELSVRLAAAERSLEAMVEAQSVRAERRPLQRAMTVAALVMIFIVAVMCGQLRVTHAQDPGQTVKAPFIVVDSHGTMIFRVAEFPDGRFATVYDSSGNPAACMRSSAEFHGTLLTSNSNGKVVTGLGVSSIGTGALEIRDQNGKVMADILRDSKGGQGVGVYDHEGKVRALLYSDPKNVPYLDIKSSKNPSALTAWADETSSAVMIGDPQSGTTVASFGKISDGVDPNTGNQMAAKPRLNMWSSTGAHIIKVGENKSGKGSIIAGEDIPDTGEQTSSAAAMGVTERGPMVALQEAGETRASVGVLDGTAHINVMAPNGTAVADLTNGANGGVLQISDMTGSSVVQAEAVEPRVGIVEAYPLNGGGAGLLPIPGTFIKGHKKSGE